MNSSKYKDLNLLTGWIGNQKAFEKHKKKLDDIYNTANVKSCKEFGITENKAFELMKNKIKNIHEQQKFNAKERFYEISKTNSMLGSKISSIQKRKNVLLNREENFNENNINLKKRIMSLKNLEYDKIKKANEIIGRRIIGKPPSINIKKLDEDYQKRLNYKNFMKKFELPKIQATGTSLIKRKLDLTPYNRQRGMPTFRSNFSSDKSREEFEANLDNSFQLQNIKKNFNR